MRVKHPIALLFFFAFVLFFSKSVFSQNAVPKELHVFLIGNSFSRNATRYLQQIAKEKGYKLIIGRAEIGGCPLRKHWELVEAAEQNKPEGKAYNGKSLKELLSNGRWDIVSIQQASILSGDIDTYRPYAEKLDSFIKRLQPDCEVVIHQTWAYRADAPGFTQIAAEKYATSAQQMWELSRTAYHDIASELKIRIIPVGDAFYEITRKDKTYKKHMAGNSRDTIARVNSPVSLNVGYFNKNGKAGFDSHHANDAGCYLGSLVWFRFLFGEKAGDITFKPKSVTDSFAKELKKAADHVHIR